MLSNGVIMLVCRINVHRRGLERAKLAVKKAVSRKFTVTSEERIAELKRQKLKKRTEAKMNWGVTAYNEWRDSRLLNYNYDFGIYYADLNNLKDLNKENFVHAMCRFVPEVTRKKGEGPYPGRTLYQLVISIQKYLHVNKIHWKILEGVEFEDLRTVLDNVMRERTEANVGTVRRQADLITYEYENELWEKGFLGEDEPDKLRNTVLFLIGINCILRAGDEHYQLRRDMAYKKSQFKFEYNLEGELCVVYYEDTCTKSNDGGLASRKVDRKIVWIYPNSYNLNRCPVRLIQKYLALCPKNTKKANFYLQSLQKTHPKQWYSNQVVGQNRLGKVIKTLLHDARIDGYFTGHSLRRTGTTRLCQAGVQKKLVKEISGHRSDARDTYQVTSHEQRK